MSDNPHTNLSFSDWPDLWTPVITGDWSRDCATGRAAAAELTRVMATLESPFMLGYVLRRMVEKGVWGGCEVGFAHEIAERTM